MTIEQDARAESDRLAAFRAEAEAIMAEARELVGLTVREQQRYIAGYLAGAQRAAPYDMPAATRVEVIDPHGGRAFTAYYDAPGVVVRVQDEGRTVKVFTGGKRAARHDTRGRKHDRA